MTEADPRKHLLDLVKSFSTAMLVSHSGDGKMWARPMSIAKVDPTGTVYFATSMTSGKVAELGSASHVLLTMQNASQYLTLEGPARIERDRKLIGDLWQDSWRVWFPSGPQDPDLCLLCVSVTEGEYWDNAGVKGIKYLMEAAKSLVTGEQPRTTTEQNAKVAI